MLTALGVVMSISAEILSLRREKSSSVANMISLIEWEQSALEPGHRARRHHAVLDASDAVLLNVAVHAADALSEPPTVRGTPRFVLPVRRKSRRSDPGQLHQRRLFA